MAHPEMTIPLSNTPNPIDPTTLRYPTTKHTIDTMKPITWAYAVTTTPKRRNDLLPRTLTSLTQAGFPKPWLFVDGDDDPKPWRKQFGLEVITRNPNIRTYGNFILALVEMWIRFPDSDYFAMFQDDFIVVKNLREYLEKVTTPKLSYRNLYTFPSNQLLCPKDEKKKYINGWYPSNQHGKGAVGLIFDNDAVAMLLCNSHTVLRVKDKTRGWRAIDGGIVTALRKMGYTEYVHSPSLIQHTGKVSSMGNKPQKLAITFPGEDFNALSLIKS